MICEKCLRKNSWIECQDKNDKNNGGMIFFKCKCGHIQDNRYRIDKRNFKIGDFIYYNDLDLDYMSNSNSASKLIFIITKVEKKDGLIYITYNDSVQNRENSTFSWNVNKVTTKYLKKILGDRIKKETNKIFKKELNKFIIDKLKFESELE